MDRHSLDLTILRLIDKATQDPDNRNASLLTTGTRLLLVADIMREVEKARPLPQDVREEARCALAAHGPLTRAQAAGLLHSWIGRHKLSREDVRAVLHTFPA